MADGVAEAYLANLNGSINLSRNYNRMLVDSGNAFITSGARRVTNTPTFRSGMK